MKKIAAIGLAVTLVVISVFGVGAPLFIGTTGNYFTNTGTQILLVASNGNAIVIGELDKSFSLLGQLTVATGLVDRLYIAKGVSSTIGTATRTGGALTNITLDAQGPQVIHADGSTNVNLVAMMNWAAGQQRPVTMLITNRTATARTFSLETTTNNWIGLGSLTAPVQVTNALWIAFENLGTSNVVYAVAYAANPTN